MRTSNLTIQKRIFLLKSGESCRATFTSIDALITYVMRHGGEYVEYVSPETLAYLEKGPEELHRTNNVENAISFVKNSGNREFIVIDTFNPGELSELMGIEEETTETHYEIQEVKLWDIK